jgi:hypothetical protein
MRIPTVSLRQALTDDDLLGGVLAGDSWSAWRTVLIGAMGEKLSWDERRLFKKLSGGRKPPSEPVDDLVAVVGRRGGKSRATAALAAYLSCLCEYPNVAAPGERLLVLCLAENQKQASVVFGFITGVFDAVPAFGELVIRKTNDTLSLSNGIDIEVRAASFRGLRGVTAVAVIADEAAYWHTEDNSANADTEILAAVRPTLATTGGLAAIISSPYAMRGELFQLHKDHFGAKGDPRILVVQGTSRQFNPSLPKSVVDRAMQRDSVAASCDYLAEFRSDDALSCFSRAAVMACVIPGRHELPPVDGVTYTGVIDPSGLGGKDSYGLCIGHRHQYNDKIVIDFLKDWRSGSPHDVSREVAEILFRYRIRRVYGDAWGSNFVREPLQPVAFEQLPTNKSQAYLDLLGTINSRGIELLSNDRAINQICSLTRYPGTTHDRVDTRDRAPEDLANVIACCAFMVSRAARTKVSWSLVGVPMTQPDFSTMNWRDYV